MRLFAVPAQYAPYLEAAIARACAEATTDADRRSDEYEPIRKMAMPDLLLDLTAEGTLAILVVRADHDHNDHAAADIPAAAGVTQ